MTLRGCIFFALTALVGARTSAAEPWQARPADAPYPPAVAAEPKLSVWTGIFDRPLRACLGQNVCSPDVSEELGIGAGFDVRIHTFGPLFVLFGLEVVRTIVDPSLNPQFILPVELGAELTWPLWPVRPLFAVLLTPLLYLSDDARDFAVSVRVGLEATVSGFGRIGFSSTRHGAETFEGFQVSLSYGR
ncbi:MAG: hypothetical protein HY791_18175 [Deltaproteobacteria bacterium]|nr:hypothetical protein [Deltaproteobacteria bacterium]